jgi:D-glycero-alpha-D-manno-heptose 1-phosphate guanylyltransferase
MTTQTCVVLAGGLGTRLRSVVTDLPKCLAPVGSRSFLDIQIKQLATAGVDKVVLSLGYMADKVIDAVRQAVPPIPVQHVVEHELLGTGGAITHVLDTLGLDEVLVANGDTWLEGDISDMFAPLARADGELFRMAVVHVPDRARFGGIETDDLGRVYRFVEKGHPEAGLINAGLYRLCRQALTACPSTKPFSLEAEVLPHLATAGAIRACHVDGSFIDIGVPEDYRRFCDTHVSQ